MAVKAPISVPVNKPITNEIYTKRILSNHQGQFVVMQEANERKETLQFAWADPGMKSVLETQLLPITFMLICQIIIKAFNDDYVFGITVGWGMYLPPIYLVSYIVGTFANYRPSYCSVSVCMAVMGLTVYAAISIMVNDITHLLQYLVLLQENVHPIGIWTPWTIIFFCNVTMIIYSTTFTVMSLVDMYKYNPQNNNVGSLFSKKNSGGIVVVIPSQQGNTEQTV